MTSDLPEPDHVTCQASSLPLAWGAETTVIRAQNGLYLRLPDVLEFRFANVEACEHLKGVRTKRTYSTSCMTYVG